MDTMTPACLAVFALALAVIVSGFALAVLSSPSSPLTGPDATEATDDDETPTADGEPMVIGDTIITLYAPSHLPALGYVIVPSRQRRQRLDGADCEATHE